MKKLVILSLVLALFTLAACSQADEKSAVELSAADTGVSKADIQSSENSIVIWDSSLPDTADKLTYIMNGETQSVYEVTDKDVIDQCISALKTITVADKTDTRYSDDTEVLIFYFENGKEYKTVFEHGNYVSEKTAYTTNGYNSFYDIVSDGQ